MIITILILIYFILRGDKQLLFERSVIIPFNFCSLVFLGINLQNHEHVNFLATVIVFCLSGEPGVAARISACLWLEAATRQIQVFEIMLLVMLMLLSTVRSWSMKEKSIIAICSEKFIKAVSYLCSYYFIYFFGLCYTYLPSPRSSFFNSLEDLQPAFLCFDI